MARRKVERCYQIDVDRAVLRARTQHPAVGFPVEYSEAVGDYWTTCQVEFFDQETLDIQLVDWFLENRARIIEKLGLPLQQRDSLLTRTVVKVEAARTPLGGTRYWFCCPFCGHRRKHLYWDGRNPIACRVCLGLQYHSSQSDRRLGTRLLGSAYAGATWTAGHDWEENRERRNKYRREKRRALRASPVV